MLHHKVVDLLGIFVPPFLLIVGVVVLPLPFCHLDKVGRILWVIWERDGWLFELTNCQCCKRAVKLLQMVCGVLRDGFEVKNEGGCRLEVPVLSKRMCSRPCVGAVNKGFFGVKER
jgi:hypothetical protein